MPFAKVETQADFPALEQKILRYWDAEKIFDQLRAKNRGKPKWSFLDGPITANNPMGVHHAWGRTYKDVYNRFFAMRGHEQRYQNGFDCQGLWVEVEVEKELGLKSKRDIENLIPGDREASIARFVQLCKDRVNKFARIQTDQSIRLGMWMDWDRGDADWSKPVDERRSYFTMSERNNYTIWCFLKKCHQKGLIYKGYDVMPWCGRCGVGISEQEMKEGYKLIEHKSCFVKFPLLDRPGENLLVWTTTPWTMTSNVGAAINPELTYLQVKLKGEIYYIAKGAFKLNRMESSPGPDGEDEPSGGKKSKREWIDGVPPLSSIEQMVKSKAGKEGFEIVGEVKGSEMLGWRYAGPFDELPAQQADYGYPLDVARVVQQRGWAGAVSAATSHRVVSGGSDVSDTEGTGIVHTAPGCGQIDFTWGKENGLPPIAPLDESGTFHEGFGPLTGKIAHDPATAEVVFEELKKKDRLFAVERYVHRYPHCWRCKTELLYRLVDEWFINMGERPERGAYLTADNRTSPTNPPASVEELHAHRHATHAYSFRQEVMKVVNQVTFLPESLNGRAREYDWLWNMGDWMISKKRFWGLALPIWVDEETGDFEVIGSREELKERAVEGWPEFDGQSPHRPYVDKIKIRNPKTGNLMSRIPDVGNPWLDAGIVAYSTMSAEWRPADFITESFPGQFRNWFYALLAMSTMMSDGQPPFRTLMGFATVKDQFGHEMHKSAGNSIEFIAAADNGGTIKDPTGKEIPFKAIGADVMRWLYCRHNPASNLNFGPGPADEVRSKFIFKLWNTYALFCNTAHGDGFEPHQPHQQVPVAERPDLDRWILSRLQKLVAKAQESYPKYDVMAFALSAEAFVDDDLSNWYVRQVKDRLNSKVEELPPAALREKWSAYQTLHTVLTTLCRCLAPCIPFITEELYQQLTGEASVHLTDFPDVDVSLLDDALESEMTALRDVITLGGAARNVAKIKVRQPLAELLVKPLNADDAMSLEKLIDRFLPLIQDELNIKKVRLTQDHLLVAGSVKLVKKTASAKLGAKGREAEQLLATLKPSDVEAQLRQGTFTLLEVPLTAQDVQIEYHCTLPDFAAAQDGRGRHAAVSTTITAELKREGQGRELIRLVNQARKNAGLEINDTITLSLVSPDPRLAELLQEHYEWIARETQATEIHTTEPPEPVQAEVQLDDLPVRVFFQKSSRSPQ